MPTIIHGRELQIGLVVEGFPLQQFDSHLQDD